jgi:hypothetical protein
MTNPSDPAARYMQRVEEHLEGLPPGERVEFLRRQRIKWIALSERFALRIDSGLTPEFGETAWDYALTLAELDKAIAKVEANGNV